jgi:hypothetical protein
MNEKIVEILEHRNTPRIMIDPYRNSYKQVIQKSLYRELVGQCLRVQVHLPAVGLPPQNSEFELERRLRALLDAHNRTILPGPIQPPEQLLVMLNLLMKLNPELTDAYALTHNACMIPAAHAVLEGRDKLKERDHLLLLHVLRATIRPWTKALLDVFCTEDGYHTLMGLEMVTGLKRVRLMEECGKLAVAGVLDWTGPVWRGNRRKWMALESGVGPDVRALMEGSVRWW